MPDVSSTGSSVEIRGLREFRTELRAAGKRWPVELTRLNREVAAFVAERARSGAQAGGPQAAKAAKAIKARATMTQARIETTRNPAFALGVFWGQKRRSGWYGAKRYAGSEARQFKPWVGNQWDPGETGGKPYYIGEAVNQSLDEVEVAYLKGLDNITRWAFPD